MKFLDAALDLVMPRRCAVCSTPLLLFEKYICTGCLADLPYTFYWERKRNPMSDKFNEKIQEHYYHGKDIDANKNSGKIKYSYATALFFFNSEAPYRHIPYKIKYGGDISLGHFFGKLLGEKIRQSEHMHDIDIIIPVPLHWSRKWKRGYNQAEAIAEGIAASTRALICTTLLYRKKRTKTQTRLEIDMKIKNVKDAFAAREYLPGQHHILLVDDVFTTGATLCSCYSVLKDMAPESRISIATLALVSN